MAESGEMQEQQQPKDVGEKQVESGNEGASGWASDASDAYPTDQYAAQDASDRISEMKSGDPLGTTPPEQSSQSQEPVTSPDGRSLNVPNLWQNNIADGYTLAGQRKSGFR